MKMVKFSDKYEVTQDNHYTLAKCKDIKFRTHQEFVNKIVSNQNNEYICVNHTDDDHVFNKNANANSAFAKIEFYKCDKNKRECPENIDILMREVYLIITFVNSFIDSSNYTNPIQYYEYSYAQQTSDAFLKRMYMSLTNDVYKSDNGWILEDYKIFEYITLQEKSLDINPNDGIETKGQMFNISIDSPNLRQITVRNYMKIQELIAKVGGLVK